MNKIPDYIILKYNCQPPLLICERCDGRRPLHIPASIDDVLLQARAFAATHKNCQEEKEGHD